MVVQVGLWDVTLCSLIDKCQLHLQEGGGSRFLSNVGTYLQNYMASHLVRLYSLIAAIMKTLNLVQIGDVWEQVAEWNIWTYGRGSKRKIEETA
jgi:hypothetical protein